MNSPEPELDLAAEIGDLLLQLIKAVVTNPNSVTVKHSSIGPLAVFVIKTHPSDVRKVIGGQGKRIRAFTEIVNSLSRQIGREAQITIDESGNGPNFQVQRSTSFVDAQSKDFSAITGLLTRTVRMFADSPTAVQVIYTAPEGTNIAVFEVKVKPSSYSALYGQPANFDYGPDGSVIGSIKNIFDGIGKNHGRVVRIVMTKL